MSLVINQCSNPKCHAPYMVSGYREALALMELNNGQLDYRVFSICARCLVMIDDLMVAETIKDVIDYETEEKHNLVTSSRRDIAEWDQKYKSYRVMAWGKNRIELDDKLAIKGT